MKKFLTLLALGLSLSLGAAHAADDKAATTQQSKMGMCNKEAGDKKGDERKAFMKECLSAKPAAASPACEKSAADKKLAGAAKSSHIKKCMADEQAGTKPEAAAKPAAAAPAAKK
ncbi:PsiF family protein [Rhodoferax sp.]|uniref:PsiF family protein n=1 Tax=Rhodoferax sp. TaxID=50421 RepID=UPI002725D855|nr:PsiF family protein [Rhodoferax sp.]MDO9196028.1 PsiF family protein [Rhodoferax sp.]